MTRAIPFNYIGSMIFYRPDNFDISEATNQIADFCRQHSSTIGNTSHLLLPLPVPFKIDITENAVELIINYKFGLANQNFIFITISLIAAIMGTGNPQFALGLITLAITVYIAMTLIQNAYIRKNIERRLNLPPFEGEAQIWHKQQQWLQQPDKCPACGEPRNAYSSSCVRCGLKLPQNAKQKSLNTIFTSTSDKRINYIYKRK